MTPRLPYLIRALYEWIQDNSLTPHLLVNTGVEGVEVPHQYIEDNRIVLNISPDAVSGLELGNDYISFSARFGGKAESIMVPVAAVLAIYARENGEGMAFPVQQIEAPEPADGKERPAETASGKPDLRIIK